MAMLPDLGGGLSDIAEVASSSQELIPTEAFGILKTIFFVFIGFIIFGFLWNILKNDQQSG